MLTDNRMADIECNIKLSEVVLNRNRIYTEWFEDAREYRQMLNTLLGDVKDLTAEINRLRSTTPLPPPRDTGCCCIYGNK
jgi:hypothetical protein